MVGGASSSLRRLALNADFHLLIVIEVDCDWASIQEQSGKWMVMNEGVWFGRDVDGGQRRIPTR